MTGWSPIKLHPESGKYYRYQDSEHTVRLLAASQREALEPNHTDTHDHYFKINGRWYVYAETPNYSLFTPPTAAGIDIVAPGESLDQLVSELKKIEPLKLEESISQPLTSSTTSKLRYRGVVY